SSLSSRQAPRWQPGSCGDGLRDVLFQIMAQLDRYTTDTTPDVLVEFLTYHSLLQLPFDSDRRANDPATPTADELPRPVERQPDRIRAAPTLRRAEIVSRHLAAFVAAGRTRRRSFLSGQDRDRRPQAHHLRRLGPVVPHRSDHHPGRRPEGQARPSPSGL